MTHPGVRRHLGGPRKRVTTLLVVNAAPLLGRGLTGPRTFVVAHRSTDEACGKVSLARRDSKRPGHVRGEGNELELSYVFLPAAWGRGYAAEACRLLLHHVASVEADQPVIVVTHSANTAPLTLAHRLGFVNHATFVEFDATQTLAVASLASFALG